MVYCFYIRKIEQKAWVICVISFLAFSNILYNGEAALPDALRSALKSGAKGTDFVVDFGNMVGADYPDSPARERLPIVLDEYRKASSPAYFLLGAKDISVSKREFVRQCNIGCRYRSIEVSNYRLVFLDSNPDSVLPPQSVSEPSPYYIDEEQLKWLARILDSSRRNIILLSHHPLLLPEGDTSAFPLRNAGDVLSILKYARGISAVFSVNDSKTSVITADNIPHISLHLPFDSEAPSYHRVFVSRSGISFSSNGEQPEFLHETEYKKQAKPCLFKFLNKKEK